MLGQLNPSPTVANSLANQYELGKMTSLANSGDFFTENPIFVLVLPPVRIDTNRYDDVCESIRTDTMQYECDTMQYDAVRW